MGTRPRYGKVWDAPSERKKPRGRVPEQLGAPLFGSDTFLSFTTFTCIHFKSWHVQVTCVITDGPVVTFWARKLSYGYRISRGPVGNKWLSGDLACKELRQYKKNNKFPDRKSVV